MAASDFSVTHDKDKEKLWDRGMGDSEYNGRWTVGKLVCRTRPSEEEPYRLT